MRFIKVLSLILLFFLAMMFLVQNTAILSQTMSLELNLYVHTWRSVPLPFYFLLLLAFLVGCLFTLFFFLIDRMQMNRQMKSYKQQQAKLTEEVNSLRNLPLEDPGYSPQPQDTSLSQPAEELE